MENTQTPAESSKKPSWVKQLYYYAVLGITILFLSIGTFTFIRSNLTRFVFTKIDDGYYTSYSEQCKYNDTYSSSKVNISSPSSPTEPKLNTAEEKASCEKRLQDEDNLRKEIDYQRNMLNSILMIIIAGTVLGLHLKFLKLKD
jgi:hypothetical protein